MFTTWNFFRNTLYMLDKNHSRTKWSTRDWCPTSTGTTATSSPSRRSLCRSKLRANSTTKARRPAKLPRSSISTMITSWRILKDKHSVLLSSHLSLPLLKIFSVEANMCVVKVWESHKIVSLCLIIQQLCSKNLRGGAHCVPPLGPDRVICTSL